MIGDCKISGCSRKNITIRRGLCSKHYMRLWEENPIHTWREIFITNNPPTKIIGKIPVDPDGTYTIVDRDIYDSCIHSNWHHSKKDGVKRCVGRKFLLLHRVITNIPDGKVVDHKNHDRLDNRRDNLRICTTAENTRNQLKTRGISRFKGVSPSTSGGKRNGRWAVFVGYNGKTNYFGCYRTEEEAARKYDEVARKLFGEFSLCNFPLPV